MRHHIEDELHDLEEYVEHHKDEIEAGDHHDPNVLEVFCDVHPDEPECLVYDDSMVLEQESIKSQHLGQDGFASGS